MSGRDSPLPADQFNTYLFEYTYGGSTWCMTVYAISEEDARRRLTRCATFGRLLGTDVIAVPAVPGAGLWVRMLTWWRNL